MINIYVFILLDLQFYFILHTLFGNIRKKSPVNWGIIQTKHTFLKFEVRLAILIQGLQQTLKKFDFISNNTKISGPTMVKKGHVITKTWLYNLL